MQKVHNLSTNEVKEYIGITPREAVIAAHAQERSDFNTWDYEKKYGEIAISVPSIKENTMHWVCGDWCSTSTLTDIPLDR